MELTIKVTGFVRHHLSRGRPDGEAIQSASARLHEDHQRKHALIAAGTYLAHFQI